MTRTECSYCRFYAAQGAQMPAEAVNPTTAHLHSHPITAERIAA